MDVLTKYPEGLVGEGLAYDEEMVDDRVVLDNRGNDETVIEEIVVVDVVTRSSFLVCSVGGVIRGLGEVKGWVWDVNGCIVTRFGGLGG